MVAYEIVVSGDKISYSVVADQRAFQNDCASCADNARGGCSLKL